MSDQEVRTVEGEVIDPDDTSLIQKVIDQLSGTDRVDVDKNGKPYFTVDEKLNPILAGYTQLSNFDKGQARNFTFIEKGSNQGYSLGNPGRRQTDFRLVNHHQALMPIAEAGFEVKRVVHNRGGAGVFALFSHPDIILSDHLSWDEDLYGDTEGTLSLSIAAWVDARLGTSLRYAVGYFRSICSNGLVSAILGLGHLRLKHTQFSGYKIEAFAENAVENNRALELATFSPKIAKATLGIVDQVHRDPDYIDSLPSFVAKPLNSAVISRPAYFQDEILYQLNMASESSNDLSTLDVLNMITNANNVSETDSTLFQLESVSESFIQLMEAAAFRIGADFNNVMVNVNTR